MLSYQPVSLCDLVPQVEPPQATVRSLLSNLLPSRRNDVYGCVLYRTHARKIFGGKCQTQGRVHADPPIGEYAEQTFLPAKPDVGSKHLVISGTSAILLPQRAASMNGPGSFTSIKSVLLAVQLILTSKLCCPCLSIRGDLEIRRLGRSVTQKAVASSQIGLGR
ncbi:hypothetical protein FIBSPDRAFT_44557 [Athelia psychrophila]|uniref:Uncharacterized protein n=1 Tax=Athelia psychrophila TaxID=1759441 RepID=A0A166U1T0_9AGAM|nr:hypothetical protein FIBSPDRAFT_44557 [Fibularhizoctonia sp. CBS 109695]